MKKILTVIGTRPQYIKYAALYRNLRKYFNEVLVDTGQHYSRNMSENLISELEIPYPHYLLGANDTDQLKQISAIMLGLGKVISRHKPEMLICFGDTNSALSAALTSVKFSIPVVHIEAGERNFDRNFKRVKSYTIPEEANRIIIDSVSAHLICASEQARKNLIRENITGNVFHAGDIMYDLYLRRIKNVIRNKAVLRKYNLTSKNYFYATIHRAINTDNPRRLEVFYNVFKNIEKTIILPLHPRTLKQLKKFSLLRKYLSLKNLIITEPLGYDVSLCLNFHSTFVLTDSGGVVREAYFNGVPSVMLDDTSEWLDIYISGWSAIAGSDENMILSFIRKFRQPSASPNFFGDGRAAAKIVNYLKKC